MVDFAQWKFALQHLKHSSGEVERRGWSSPLVIDNRECVARLRGGHDRPDEVAAERAVDPSRPHDNMARIGCTHLFLAGKLAHAVNIDRIWRGGLVVSLGRGSIE